MYFELENCAIRKVLPLSEIYKSHGPTARLISYPDRLPKPRPLLSGYL